MIEKERLSKHNFMPEWVKIEHKARFDYVKGFTRDKIVIDCACGNGTGPAIYRKEAKFVHAFYISIDAVREAANYEGSNIIFQIGDAINLPLDDGFADVYISLETIEHLTDDLAYLKEANRVLKKGGKYAPFYIAVRIHQLIKLISYPFRRKDYYDMQDKKEDSIFEYMTAVCVN